MDPSEKLAQSELAKSKGTALFKAANFTAALKKYRQIVKFLEEDTDYTDEQKVQRASLSLAAHLNCALCYLKQESWSEAREECNKALEFDNNNEKAFFRRGQVRLFVKIINL